MGAESIGPNLPMSGENTELGVSAPDLAGYLGKVNESTAQVKNCPWCSAKGQVFALRSYRINIHESVTLCTNPESKRRKPEDLDGTTDPRCTVGLCQSRVSLQSVSLHGNGEAMETVTHLQEEGSGCHMDLDLSDQACKPCNRDLCHTPVFGDGSHELDSPGLQNDLEPSNPMEDAEKAGAEIGSAAVFVQGGRLTEDHEECMEGLEARLTEEFKVRPTVEKEEMTLEDEEGKLKKEQQVQTVEEKEVSLAEEQEVRLTVAQEGELELVNAPSHLFWRNEHNLCWLNTMLVAVVHCRALREHVVSMLEDKSPLRRLCHGYNKACGLVKAKEQMDDKDKTVKVPSAVLNQAQRELEELQMSAFKLIQPKLQCKLGEKETPVFALPLLLRLDLCAEIQFEHTFNWHFECAACGHSFSNSVSPVFMLHFVEGLPQNDVTAYSFDFKGNHHVVSTVIQYDQHLKHFVTWIQDSSGSWLEFDDLKYPRCISHKTLPVPPDQIHVVFWEVQVARQEARSTDRALSDTSTGLKVTGSDAQQLDLSIPFPQNDTFIVDALTEEDVDGAPTETSPSGPDTSIGSATLLDAFEGLSHNDIVTLTLMEVKVDAEGRPLDSSGNSSGLNERMHTSVETTHVSSTVAHSESQSPPKYQETERAVKRDGLTEKKARLLDQDIVLPSVIACPKPPPPAPPTTKVPRPTALSNARWSLLLSKHPSFQSTPILPKCTSATPTLKPTMKITDDKSLPAKAAEMFGGFQPRGVTKQMNTLSNGDHCPSVELGMKNTAFKQPWVKSPSQPPSVLASFKSLCGTEGPGPIESTTVLASETSANSNLNKSSALRQKLLKKLKKKKKMLAALDKMLDKGTGDTPQRPDSTILTSPYTVSSSTSLCSSPDSSYEQFFTDLLSPATTTASSLSPDSTSLLEMLVTGHEGAEVASESPSAPQPQGMGSVVTKSTVNNLGSTNDDFLDEFMSGSQLQACNSENVDFNVFDMFF
ncbi:hypothetical protein JZ751_023066 [Albula glossodonta]|uniref:USP domain-containing protein n=1 Tax=Albula glossodonta TaxID=121402 RepID=A0A8T2PH02_9TELE|nr:hypothetical protein JZ751_023066 [Albula glossodonta]